MFNLAELCGLRPDGSNPCLHLKRYREEARERFLTQNEFARLGRVLDAVDEDGSETRSAVTAIRLLMLTGCRLSEIQTLRWEYIDLESGELHLPDTKTGSRIVPLAPDRSASSLAPNTGTRRARRRPHPRLAPLLCIRAYPSGCLNAINYLN